MGKEEKRGRGRPKGTKKKGKSYLDQREREQFMKAVRRGKSKRDIYLFELILYLGLRCVEAKVMKLDKNDNFSLPESEKKDKPWGFVDDMGSLHMKGAKKGKMKEYDLKKKNGLWNLHKAWLRERAKIPGAECNPYLFTTERSVKKENSIDKNTIQYLFKMYARKAGLHSRYSVHSLRHTTGIILAEQGLPAYTIMRWLRQKKITSAQEYIDLVGVEAKREEDRVAEAFNS